jgi:5'-3' exonuclease
MKGYLIIDGSNVSFAAASMRKLTVGEQDTHAVFGVLRSLRPLVSMFPMLKPVVLWDGRSWRYDYFPEYKARRAKPPETKQEILQAEIRASLKSQRPLIQEALTHLGIGQAVAMNLEADDLAGVLVRRYVPQGNKVMLVTGDKDWIQLVGPGVGWLNPIADAKVKRVTAATLEKTFGVKSPRAFLEMKALTGDLSDDLCGVGGIGPAGAVELLNTYGTVSAFCNQCMDGTIDTATVSKKFRDFAEDEAKQILFTRNMDLMDLNSPKIPKPQDLRVTKGAFNAVAFEEFCERWMFSSMTKDIDGWVSPFRQALAEAA